MPRRPAEPSLPASPAPPRVALLVETSLGSGRDILRGIAQYARNHGPWSLYHEPRSLEEGLPAWFRAWRGAGLIVRVRDPALARAVRALGLPVVDVLGAAPEAGFPLVHVDDAAVARMAAAHLVERGFHHFAFMGIERENWSAARGEGFRRALPGPPDDLPRFLFPRRFLGRHPLDTGLSALTAWVAALPRPTGILAASDQLGPHLLEACRRAGVAVPDDVAVVGVDNDETLCEVCSPGLSSVDAGHRAVGFQAAQLLDRLLSGAAPPAEAVRVAPLGVVVRASSDVLATADREVAAALRLIRGEAAAGLSAADLAARLPVSRSVLQRRFRRETGRSIQQEIIQVRLDHARRLLAETDLPLAEVAEAAGFRHREYLAATFKAHTGQSPGEYRREATPRGAGG